MSIATLIIISLIVGVVTAGISIRFDRFFVVILLLFLAGIAIKSAINIFLVVIFLGSITVLVESGASLNKITRENRANFLITVPLFAALSSFFGSWLFFVAPSTVLIVTFGVLAVFYGLRLIFIHFKEEEKNQTNPKPTVQKLCGIFGPMVSGFFIGFIGTSLKSLKIPFAVKFGKMNFNQVYVGSVITAAYASFFAIAWHFVLGVDSIMSLLYGAAIWGIVHATSDVATALFPARWRKGFQVIIGLALLVAAIKIFNLV